MDSSNLRDQLDNAKGEQDEETENEPEVEEQEQPDPDDAAAEHAGETDDGEEAEELTTEERRKTPSFPYADAMQRGLHPREETWEVYDDAMYEAEGVLRKRGVKEVEKREFDDALLRLSLEHSDRLGELVMEARGLESDDND